jgi:hypothetical protein
LVTLDEGYGLPELRGANRRNISSRAATDNYDLELLITCGHSASFLQHERQRLLEAPLNNLQEPCGCSSIHDTVIA